MSTGWKYVFSNGEEFKSSVAARQYLKEHPTLTVVFSELSMAGAKLTDVTEDFRKALSAREEGADTR